MSVKKKGLGRGLDVLLGSVGADSAETAGDELRELSIDSLVPGRHQPRRAFDDAALAELANSIRAQGVVQPLVVRPAAGGKYEIVAGERRWRAAKLAGLKAVPAVIRNMDERTTMAVALVENIQRADLNPLEEALALHKLIKECGLTHDKCAEAVGKSRAAVSNLLRLMDLNDDVQQLVRDARLSLGHAKVLLGVEGPRQSALAKTAVEQQLSVRQVEALVQAQGAAKPKAKTAKGGKGHKLESELAQRLGLSVKLQQNEQGRGKLTIAFKSQAELDKLLAAF